MKKKHFLFTSLAIAAILSANVAHAEEGTTTVNEPENELILSEENKSEQPSTDPQAEDSWEQDSANSHRSVLETEEVLNVPLGSSELPGVEVTVERTFDQTAVREEALIAIRELREEMWDLNPWFDGKKLQDVVKEAGFQGKEDYAQALEWDNELEAYAVQRSVEVSYAWGHKRPDGSRALKTGPDKVSGENLSMGYPTVTAAIKQSWGYGELDALNATQGWPSKPSQEANGHLHNQLNPQFKSFGIGASNKYYAQSLSRLAAETTDGLQLDGKHTLKLKVTEDLAKHKDFMTVEEPKEKEQEVKTITFGWDNLNGKGYYSETHTIKPGETITNSWSTEEYDYVVGKPGVLTYDEIVDGGTYVTIVRSKDRTNRLNWGVTEYRLLDFLNSAAFNQAEKESIREAALDILRQQLEDANHFLDVYELTEEQQASVQASNDKYLLTFNNLRTGVADSSTLPTREENIAFDAVVDLWQSGKLKSKPWSDNKAYKGETKTITVGYSNSGVKGFLETDRIILPWETIGGVLNDSDNKVYVLGPIDRLSYDEIEDGGVYLIAYYNKSDRRKTALASSLIEWLTATTFDQKNETAIRKAVEKLLSEEMVDAEHLLTAFELDASQESIVQTHYDKTSHTLSKFKGGENDSSGLSTFEEYQAFEALRKDGEQGKLVAKVKQLLTDNNGSSLTVELSPEEGVRSLEVVSHIEPTAVNPSPIARLAGQDFDLYDIKLKDAQGQLVSNLKQNALVKLPVDSGKEVIKVIYLPETGEATELPILKQDDAFVYFETNHFSHYGIVYKKVNHSIPKQPETSTPQDTTGMDIDAIHNGDYRSVQGIWSLVNGAQGQPEFIRLTDNGFFSAPELNFKAVKLGEVKEVPNRYKWGRMIATSQGYPTDWIGYHNSEGINVTYVPKGGAYSLWDADFGKSVEKIAAEDIIISRGLGYQAVYARARSVDHFYDVTAGDYGMGTLVDSLGRSIVDNKTVVVTGQLGDTIDLNAVGGRFDREGKAIYRVTLSNGKDELTLPDYQSSFTLTEQLKQYDRISIVYETSLVLKDKEQKQPHSPAPQGQGNNQQTPAPQVSGNGQQTPAPQVSGNGQQTPAPQVSGNGQQAPAPQGQGNDQQTPVPQTDLSTRRNQALLELDKSPLTDGQKGQLAEKFTFADTEKELADVTAEFKRLTAALSQESKRQTPQTPQKADAKATLPATGEAKPAVLAMIGAGLLLASLGLAYHRKRS